MLAAMKSGKHAATEVPAAITIDECWSLVETAEKTRRHCVMMENCCYDRPELMVLRMLREGLFGEAMHAEVGYQHDLRAIKFETRNEGLWRRAHATKRNANFYTTHGLGPAAQAMGVNRGDQFDYIVAMAGNSRGLQDWQREKLAGDDRRRAERYVLSDVHTALIRTKLGKTIYLVHDTNLPRPYARYNVFQGTKGIYAGFPPRFYFDGQEPSHRYKPLADFAETWDHPLWKRVGANASGRGHGGMDFIEDVRLIECLRVGAPTDFDVYDAAAWSCIQELTARSVANRSRSLDVPDFTRGRWKERPPLGVVS
jgi:predicted dehydrogenase